METATLRRIDGTDTWMLVEPLNYHHAGLHYTVRRGFLTDGASIPRIFWAWVGHPLQEYTEAAILHDALCRSGDWPLQHCDRVMAAAMRDHGTRADVARTISAGLAISRIWRRKGRPDPRSHEYLTVRV